MLILKPGSKEDVDVRLTTRLRGWFKGMPRNQNKVRDSRSTGGSPMPVPEVALQRAPRCHHCWRQAVSRASGAFCLGLASTYPRMLTQKVSRKLHAKCQGTPTKIEQMGGPLAKIFKGSLMRALLGLPRLPGRLAGMVLKGFRTLRDVF